MCLLQASYMQAKTNKKQYNFFLSCTQFLYFQQNSETQNEKSLQQAWSAYFVAIRRKTKCCPFLFTSKHGRVFFLRSEVAIDKDTLQRVSFGAAKRSCTRRLKKHPSKTALLSVFRKPRQYTRVRKLLCANTHVLDRKGCVCNTHVHVGARLKKKRLCAGRKSLKRES